MDFIKNPEIYKFLVIGLTASISVYLLTILFTSFLYILYTISVALAFEITVIWTFFPLDRWVFSEKNKKSRTIIRFLKLNSFSLIGLAVNESVLILLTSTLGFHYTLSEAVAIGITFFFNYSVSKKITWKN